MPGSEEDGGGAAPPERLADRAREASPPESGSIEPRTLRGLSVALTCAAIALVYVHGVRPAMAHAHLNTHLPEDVGSFVKGTLAFSAYGFALFALVRKLAGRPFARARIRSVMVTIAALSAISFVLVDDLRAENYLHRWEFFHYYVGSKYSDELGYTRIYRCTAVAQAEVSPAWRAEVMDRKIRNLETNVLEPAALALEDPEACKSHFSPERWELFKRDVSWFRGDMNRAIWDRVQRDHGYNPPPVWTMMGRFFGSIAPVAGDGPLHILSSLGPIVYALTFFFVWWAFGQDTCAIAVIFWATEYPANGYFTAGAFLREDWLLFLLLSACLLRKRRWALAGAALATSASLRLFPVFFFAGIVVVAGAHVIRHRRVAPHHARFFAGALAAAAGLFALSAALVGLPAYGEFARHIQHHGHTPTSNLVGLPAIISYTRDIDADAPHDPAQPVDDLGGVKWSAAHEAALERRWPLTYAADALVLLAFVWCVRRVKTLWIAMALSASLVVTMLALSCYYYCFLALLGLLAKASARAARGLLFTAGLSAMIFVWPRVSNRWDDRYAVQSAIFLVLTLLLLRGFSGDRSKRSAPAAPATA